MLSCHSPAQAVENLAMAKTSVLSRRRLTDSAVNTFASVRDVVKSLHEGRGIQTNLMSSSLMQKVKARIAYFCTFEARTGQGKLPKLIVGQAAASAMVAALKDPLMTMTCSGADFIRLSL